MTKVADWVAQTSQVSTHRKLRVSLSSIHVSSQVRKADVGQTRVS